MSVRVRLTLWYVAVLCVGLTLFAGAVVWQTDRAADAALAQALVRRAQDVVADLRLGRPITLRRDAPDESARQPGEATLWIRVLDAQGRVAVRQGPVLPGVPARLLADTRAGLRSYELAHGQGVRVLVLPVLRGGHRLAGAGPAAGPLSGRGHLPGAPGDAARLCPAIPMLTHGAQRRAGRDATTNTHDLEHICEFIVARSG